MLVFVSILVAIVAVIRSSDILGDHGLVNVGTLILSFVVVVTLGVWFFFFSGYGRRVRLGAAAIFVVIAAVFVTVVRVETVDGELVPVFAYRFSAKHSKPLSLPDGAVGDAYGMSVDLRTTTEFDFPQFLGLRRSDSVENVRLAHSWTDRPPELVWRHEIGAGWSAFSVVNGHAVTMEQRGDEEMVICYGVASGKLEWAYSSAARFEKFEAGVGPRSTPTIDNGRVFALGAFGHLVCLDGATGKCVWEKNLLEEGGVSLADEAAAVPWGRSASPLVVGEKVIVPLGGRKDGELVSLVAYDKRDGTLLWKGGERQISYSSPAVATVAGVEQILTVNEDTLAGHDLATGKTLWEQPWKGHTNRDPNVSQAVPIEGDRVFISKGYGGGAMLLRLVTSTGGELAAETIWAKRNVMKTKFTNVAVRGNFVYGLSDGILECIDLTDGRSQWKQGRYGHGQILLVDDLLLVLSEQGEVVLVEADSTRPNNVLGRFQAIEGLTWNNFALSGPYLLVRNAEEAACYRLTLEK
jgi:outer membrane protein assembly factor BamB